MANRGTPLKRSLLFNLTAGVALLGGILLAISLAATNRTVARLSGALTNRVIATVDAQLMGFFEPVQEVLEITAERALHDDFDEFPLDDFDDYFAPLIARMPQLSSVMYAHDNGDEYMLLRADDRWESRITRPDTWGSYEDWRQWVEHDERKTPQRRELDYDSRQRAWHIGAVERLEALGEESSWRQRIHWTPPYRFFTTGEPGLTASLAHRLDSGRVIILGFDILLADISRFTSQLEVGQRGKAFALRGNPLQADDLAVIGVPSDERYGNEMQIVDVILSRPAELGGPVAAFIAEALVTHHEPPGKPVRFVHGGEAWWGEIARSGLQASEDVWVGSVVPEAELLEDLPNYGLIVLLTTALVLLLAVARAIWLAGRYAQPLEELTARGNRMQRLNFEPVEPVGSNIAEIRNLSSTLERMRAALHTFSAAREDLRVARAMHDMLLPQALPEPTAFELAAWHEPTAGVSGEFFEALTLDDHASGGNDSGLLLALITLPGSGLDAAMYGTQLRAALRAYVDQHVELEALARKLDAFVRRDLGEVGPVNAWLLRAHPGVARVEIVGCGDDAIRRTAGSCVESVPAAGPRLGLGPAGAPVVPVSMDLAAGDLLAIVSPGVTDALDDDRVRYGFGGLETALRECATVPRRTWQNEFSKTWRRTGRAPPRPGPYSYCAPADYCAPAAVSSIRYATTSRSAAFLSMPFSSACW